MKKAERIVLFYDLKIEARSRTFEAPKTISARRAFELMELVPLEQRLKESARGMELLYISDWQRHDDTLHILISKSDKAISDPVFTIPQQRMRRTAAKAEQEGQDFSVHIVLQLPQDDLAPALCLVENCAGLGAFFIRRLLNQILADAKKISPADFEQFHPDGAVDENGKPKKYNVGFKCLLDGHLSDDLKNDLDQGKVQSIELITEKTQHTQIDEDGYITEKCKTLVLTLKDDAHPVRDKFNRIVNVVQGKKDDYSHARIKFKTPEGIDRTVDMNAEEGLAQTYVKKAKLGNFKNDLKSSYEKFNVEIIEKMTELVTPEP
ncbi:MAG: hypothetical protein NVS3B3_23810 [Aquirhabdus sp.]